jgi:hypothetical protein
MKVIDELNASKASVASLLSEKSDSLEKSITAGATEAL